MVNQQRDKVINTHTYFLEKYEIYAIFNIEFFELDKTILDKALNILVKKGNAQIFKGTDEDSMGVKFFGAQ